MKEDFQVELLGIYPLEECLEREKELAMTSLFPKGLNGNAGCYIEITDDVKKKMSLASKGKPKSEEHRNKLSGENNPFYGKKHSEESKRKNSDAHKGKKNARFGRSHSEETRKKMSLASKGKPKSEEHRRKMSEINKGKIFSIETRIKISESLKNTKRNKDNGGKVYTQDS